jgi:hypothetical protein
MGGAYEMHEIYEIYMCKGFGVRKPKGKRALGRPNCR